jgi:DNA/RNA endonuclease YhcR with UshA esterase domain
MRHVLATVLAMGCLAVVSPAFADPLTPQEAAASIGSSATVEGTVSEVFTDRKSGTTFLDMGGRYPNETFSGVIFSEDAGTFPNASALGGRTVDVTGRVTAYQGRPEIILKSADQLKLR